MHKYYVYSLLDNTAIIAINFFVLLVDRILFDSNFIYLILYTIIFIFNTRITINLIMVFITRTYKFMYLQDFFTTQENMLTHMFHDNSYFFSL